MNDDGTYQETRAEAYQEERYQEERKQKGCPPNHGPRCEVCIPSDCWKDYYDERRK